jgi:hypothetical protein
VIFCLCKCVEKVTHKKEYLSHGILLNARIIISPLERIRTSIKNVFVVMASLIMLITFRTNGFEYYSCLLKLIAFTM